MTNQEAIEHIKTIKIYSYYDGYTDEAREALDMAISALKAQDLQPTCNQLATDCIGRHDAISRIQNAYMDTHDGADREAVNINVGLTKALHIMQDMPATQPEQRWIPVSERLPSPLEWDEKYLVSLAWGGIGVMEYKSTGFHNYGSFNPVPIETVTAWMPLPEPYRGEGE